MSGRREEWESFVAVGWSLAGFRDSRRALEALSCVAVRALPGARWGSVSRHRRGRLCTVAWSDPTARAVDGLQREAGVGPTIDTARLHTGCVSPDLSTERRWPGFGPHAVRALGVHGVVSARLAVDADDSDAVLTVYADHVGAFDGASCELLALLASAAAVGVAAVVNRELARDLTRALASNREIGVAMGVLMTRHQLSREQAFELLRSASQNRNEKLRDVATEVADTGVLPAVHGRHEPLPG